MQALEAAIDAGTGTLDLADDNERTDQLVNIESLKIVDDNGTAPLEASMGQGTGVMEV